MDKLIYKTFTWPRNPDHYRQTWSRMPVYTEDEAGELVYGGMGPKEITVTGSGSFCGDTAYGDFQKLIALFQEGTVGNLAHPNWGNLSCFLTELELTQEPRENYVAYRFTFRGKKA